MILHKHGLVEGSRGGAEIALLLWRKNAPRNVEKGVMNPKKAFKATFVVKVEKKLLLVILFTRTFVCIGGTGGTYAAAWCVCGDWIY